MHGGSLIDGLLLLENVDCLTQFMQSDIIGTAQEDMCLRGNFSAHGRLLLVDLVNNPSLVRSVGVQFWLLPCTRIELEFDIPATSTKGLFYFFVSCAILEL